MAARDDDVVWSSTDGDLRRRGDRPAAPAHAPAGRVTVRRETSGRRGKAVTTVSGLPVAEDGLRDLATVLKKRCGVGGTVKGGVIELQGDHRVKVADALRAAGYEPVLAGG